MGVTVELKDVFLLSSSSVTGPEEAKGPLKGTFDYSFEEIRAGENAFEDGEMKMISMALDLALKKARLRYEDIGVCFGGDLNNQLAISNHALAGFPFSFIGVYGACSTSMLSLGLAACFVHANFVDQALSFTSSNYGCSERQFRYPTTYGIKKKDTTTITVTGAGASIVSKKRTKIQVASVTFGEVKNSHTPDVSDMGSIMTLGAYQTIRDHFEHLHRSPKDYDLIVTGDLSLYGSKILQEMFEKDGIHLINYADAGNLIYDKDKQKVFAGGSGCACLALVSYGYIIEKLIRKEMKRVLLVGTGALHSKTSAAQQKDIPVIAHAVELVRVEE